MVIILSFFQISEGGASTNPCSDVYAGPSAGSEVETQNVMNYLIQNKDKIDFYLSFHSYGQYMLFPFGHEGADYSDNYYDWMEMAESAAVALFRRNQIAYQLGTTADVLCKILNVSGMISKFLNSLHLSTDVASGVSPDWAHGVEGIPIAITYEFRDTGSHGFILPAEQIIPNAEEVLDSLVAFMGKGKELGYFPRRAWIS